MTIDDSFNRFHDDNPHVFTQLVEMTIQIKQAGRTCIGIGMFFEVLRWEHLISTNSHDDFKLNNNYRSRYVRLIMAEHPELDGMFDIRFLPSKGQR